jgi:hypothetical protein
MLRIERTRTTPYRPQANGQNERTNRTLIELLRSTQEHHEDWYRRISHVCFAYNSTPHAAHGFSPFYLMFGEEPYCDLDVRLPGGRSVQPTPVNEHAAELAQHMQDAHDAARTALQHSAETRKAYYDRTIGDPRNSGRVRMFQPGEQVLLKVSDHHMHFGKLNERFVGPYYVITVFGNGNVRVKEAHDRCPKMVHHDRLRRFQPDAVTPTPLWVEQAIDSFACRVTTAVQTEEGEMEDPPPQEPRGVECCRICNTGRLDQHAIVRVLDTDQVCQLCRLALE